MDIDRYNPILNTSERIRRAHPLYRQAVARCLLSVYQREPQWGSQRSNEILEEIDHTVFKAAFRGQQKEWNQALREEITKSKVWTTHRRKRKGKDSLHAGDAIRIQILLRRPVYLDQYSDQTNRTLELGTKKPSITIVLHASPTTAEPDFKKGSAYAVARLVGSPSFFEHIDYEYGSGSASIRFRCACKSEEMDAITQALYQGKVKKIPHLFRRLLDAWFNPNSRIKPKIVHDKKY